MLKKNIYGSCSRRSLESRSLKSRLCREEDSCLLEE